MLREAARSDDSALEVEIVEIHTTGDADKQRRFEDLGPKGIFAHELQRALLEGRIDVAVHSLKDLQSAEPEGLALAAVCEREDPRDVLVSRSGSSLADLDPSAVVGTSSVRREALVRRLRPDVTLAPLRGNVDTRLRKVADGEVDAAVLAAAGVIRLGRPSEVTEWLDPMTFVPPPGQGAIAIEARADRITTDLAWMQRAEHAPTRACVDAERAFMHVIEGSCDVPLGAWARVDGAGVLLEAFVASRDGAVYLRDSSRGTDPIEVGRDLGARLLAAGAADVVARR